jgi:hypothetical protein
MKAKKMHSMGSYLLDCNMASGPGHDAYIYMHAEQLQ